MLLVSLKTVSDNFLRSRILFEISWIYFKKFDEVGSETILFKEKTTKSSVFHGISVILKLLLNYWTVKKTLYGRAAQNAEEQSYGFVMSSFAFCSEINNFIWKTFPFLLIFPAFQPITTKPWKIKHIFKLQKM